MTSKKAIRILKKHVNQFLSGAGQCFYVTPKDEQDLLDALQFATDAIKKTIPVQPVPEMDWPGTVTRCPACRALLYDSDFDISTSRKAHVGFCIYCGQRFTKPSDTLDRWEEIKNCKERRNKK